MAKIYGGEAIGRVLKEEGVKYYFGVHGGHIWSMMAGIQKHGIKMIHMRHEQAGGYAADAWARTTGQPGVCFATAGPGMTNLASGVSQSWYCMSPTIALLGQHGPESDYRSPLQEGYGAELYKTITKWSYRIVDWNTISHHIRRAFREATTYPPGPVALEFPINVQTAMGTDNQIGYKPREKPTPAIDTQADPAMIEKAVTMLLNAERPVVVGGDGIFWDNASDELKEFVELLQIPVHTRRMGRGAVAEDHPLAFSGGYRRTLFANADAFMIIGLRESVLEAYFEPPVWNEKARYIQIQESPRELSSALATEVAMVGSPKLVLRQMIDCARSLIKGKPGRQAWLDTLAKAREDWSVKARARGAQFRDARPIHPDFLGQEIVDFLDPNATVIYDSYTGSAFITDKIKARFAGQVLDSGTQAGVGHGIGMGIGAQLGRPGKQVFVMMGDGGMGIGGMDIETARRYNLPVVYLIYNNSSWISNFRELFLPQLESWDMLPDIRYDKMFEVLGCHAEHVEDPAEIRPALERAFNSGKTSVINVIPDRTVMQPFSIRMGQGLAASPWQGLANMSKEAPRVLGMPAPKTE